jgi:L-amino acid N-acyltransferase YncA
MNTVAVADHRPNFVRSRQQAPKSDQPSRNYATVTAMPAHNHRARRPEDTGMQGSSSGVRAASARDAAACLAIYRPYVLDTAISWEIEVPSVGEMAARIEGLRATHEWLVLERGGEIIGFAYGQPLKRLATFRWSAETGIYLDSAHHRAGGGRELYTALLRRLAERGYRQVFAAITQPNEASNGFHRSFGFQEAGSYRRVAWKRDSWHDVAWMRLDLRDTGGPDGPPDPIR